jgi:Uma2 family endonuclease
MADLTRTDMTAEEFLALPETNQFIQLVQGRVIPKSSRNDKHQALLQSAAIYLKWTVPDGRLCIGPMDVCFDDGNVVQPDVFWVSDDNHQCVLVDGKYWQGPPTLVIEILSPSTESLDWREKFDLYEKFGVREYWLISQTLSVHVFRFQNGKSVQQGTYGVGETFISSVLNNHNVDVTKLLDQ